MPASRKHAAVLPFIAGHSGQMLLSKVMSANQPPSTRILVAISTELATVEKSCAGVLAGAFSFAEPEDIFFHRRASGRFRRACLAVLSTSCPAR